MRILLTGARGQVGRELVHTLAPLGTLIATDRTTLDLAHEGAIRNAIRTAAPDVVVNAAAYTAVDAAESDPDAAHWLNAEVPRILAEESARLGALLVHYSTDYVFDGQSDRPYREDDLTGPLNVYGRTKLAGEQAVQAAAAHHLIMRIAWVYARQGRNFLTTILRLARERDVLRVVDDQVGPPTWARAVAQATAALLAQHPAPSTSGIYHIAAPDGCSWHAFASEILRRDPRGHEQVVRQLDGIDSATFPTAARRPPYSMLATSKVEDAFGLRLPGWHAQLEQCLQEGYVQGMVARESLP